jgi:hypothetical protein
MAMHDFAGWYHNCTDMSPSAFPVMQGRLHLCGVDHIPAAVLLCMGCVRELADIFGPVLQRLQ